MVSSRMGREIPVGGDVSNLFPWWRTGVIDLGEDGATPTDGRRFTFAPGGLDLAEGQRREPHLKNDQPGPVAVQEVRWWSNQPFTSTGQDAYQGDFLDGMSIQMDTDLLQGVIQEWIPCKAMHTEEERLFYGGQWAGVISLRTPYFVQAQQQFGLRMRVRRDPAIAAFSWAPETYIDIQLRGSDPLTGVPVSYDKRIEMPPVVAGTGEPREYDYFFDDDRDAPIRDMMLTDIAFGSVSMQTTTPTAMPWLALDPIDIKFLPPTGPSWTSDIFTHLAQGLFDDVGSCYLIEAGSEAVRYPVIHRPKAPYVLRPGDSFRIHAMWDQLPSSKRGDLTGTGPAHSYVAGQNLVFCRISGVQEGTNA